MDGTTVAVFNAEDVAREVIAARDGTGIPPYAMIALAVDGWCKRNGYDASKMQRTVWRVAVYEAIRALA